MDRLREILENDQANELERNAGNSIDGDYDNEVEVFAFSVEQALQNASEALGTSIVNLEYEIMEKGTNGIFGFYKKPYRILVRKTSSMDTTHIMGGLQTDFDAHNAVLQNQDGMFKVQVRKAGVMLKVTAPKGEGKPVDFAAIIGNLQRREINNADQNAIKKTLARASGDWVRIGDYIPSPNDSIVQMQIAPDEMKAFVTITKPEKFGRVPESEEIISLLKGKNVHYGFKENVIKDSIDNELFNMPILVAEGDMPIEGKDAEIRYHFKTANDEVKFAVADDGSVDFHKLDIIQSVVVGQVLATKVPGEKGKAGRTITGRIIPARDGRDVKLIPGTNTQPSPDNMQIVSTINGHVNFKNGRVNVEEVWEVTGDVDMTTGDINYPGTVIIYGNVNDTFKVYSGGNIEIKGNVGKAEVVAEGDIIVRQGIQGKDEAKITCGGELYARFIERCNIKTEGDIFVTEVILHCHVDCKSNIYVSGGKRSQIAGGHVRALKEINAKFLGAEAYTETLLEAGIDPDAEDKLIEVIRRRDELSKELSEIGKQLNNLSMMMASGPLPPGKEETYQMLSVKNIEFKEELNALSEQAEELQKYLESLGKDAKISASKTTYPGVKIKIKNLTLPIKTEFKFVTFYKEGADIRYVPYEKPKEIDEKLLAMSKRKI
ncbi:MAG: FapA family protein [Brevinematales bacterium]|nr:FapA family protein [Brevinematales bacterium]